MYGFKCAHLLIHFQHVSANKTKMNKHVIQSMAQTLVVDNVCWFRGHLFASIQSWSFITCLLIHPHLIGF